MRAGDSNSHTFRYQDLNPFEPLPTAVGPCRQMPFVLVRAVLRCDDWDVARELLQRPPLVLRYTRQLFTQNFKRAFLATWATAWRARPTPSDSSSPRAAACGASTARGIRNPGPTD